MSVSLEKGQKVSLQKEGGEALKQVAIGLGWDEKQGGSSGADFDLDASLYALKADGKVRAAGDFVYFNNLAGVDGAVVHTGDNLTGEGDGDDEVINVDLTKIPEAIVKLVIVVNVFQGKQRGQNFGLVENSFMRIVNQEDNKEMFKFDLNFDASVATGVIFGTLIKRNGVWNFSADQTEFEGGLEALNAQYGV